MKVIIVLVCALCILNVLPVHSKPTRTTDTSKQSIGGVDCDDEIDNAHPIPDEEEAVPLPEQENVDDVDAPKEPELDNEHDHDSEHEIDELHRIHGSIADLVINLKGVNIDQLTAQNRPMVSLVLNIDNEEHEHVIDPVLPHQPEDNIIEPHVEISLEEIQDNDTVDGEKPIVEQDKLDEDEGRLLFNKRN